MKIQRPGFTLVELLVVITIIGILMGLLIPAVNAARETARRNQCSTQLSNLSLAAYQFSMKKGYLPPYVDDFGLFAGGIDPADSGALATIIPAHRKVGTWAVHLLPDLDGQATWERWNEDRYPIITTNAAGSDFSPSNSDFDGRGYHPEAAPNLPIMQCPSNPRDIAFIGKNSYVINTGLAHLRTAEAATAGGGSGGASQIFSYLFSQGRSNGATNANYDGNYSGTDPGVGPNVRLEDIKDGQGATVLVSENMQALPWHRAGFLHGNHTEASLTSLAGGNLDMSAVGVFPAIRLAKYTNGMVWHFEDADAVNLAGLSPIPYKIDPAVPGTVPITVLQKHRVNGGGQFVSDDIFNLEMDATNCVDLARPSSAHVGGANAAMVDRSTRFLSEEIDYRVYQALLTPRGKSSSVPWPEYVLDTESY